MAISMLKIRRPLGRLIFNMGIAIPGKTVFLIEAAPCFYTIEAITHLPISNDQNLSRVYILSVWYSEVMANDMLR